MRKIIFVLLLSFCILNVNATNYKIETNISAEHCATASLGGAGMTFCFNEGDSIYQIEKTPSDGSTVCYVYINQSAKSILAQGTFIGANCSINLLLNSSQCVIISGNNAGSTYDACYDDSTNPYPMVTERGNFTSGNLYWDGNFWQWNTNKWTIRSIYLNHTYTTNNSISLNTDLINNKSFNISPAVIRYNASIVGYNEIFNCTLYIDNALNITQLNVNLTANQAYSVAFHNRSDTHTMNISCSSSEIIIQIYRADISFNNPEVIPPVDYSELLYREQQKTNEAIDMLGYMLFWIGLLFVSYKMIRDGNFVSGVPLILCTLGFCIYFANKIAGVSVILEWTFILITLSIGGSAIFIRKSNVRG